ncbi:short chain enoyl-CoA hydratase /3-hydroxyacyl-CoA dehydrogenase [Roseovarius halotolerans]|uniref:Fatty acid oxidation complex subunit alpha n=1 Tax=Roseovarius halotolerans TaxID=505353 RepID=A0A1X6Y817_9RHOB|nr:3-hydroxyacyl-CoA dehydrogenase NAD-binding domain-containing protein [Roseovarius halotolerans]RKT35165.1 short chain enoyl-CoA hydratase /3-hydroxyacyl-CoA dehydrogenase [Roseovarius halotolerans]SLN12741.1 Fatty acid oxidation complex subunit alpha [Roseovarius halotolerans]
MTDLIERFTRGPLGIIRMTRQPVNALGHALRCAISEAHRDFDADPAIAAIVLTGSGRFFSAGADITEFDSGRKPPYLTDLIDQLEQGGTPVVALINGIAFGGGLELSLGCDDIYLLPKAKLALPEIKLGIIPGAGGTQKLPRVIGGPEALAFILKGDPINADKACALGLARAIAPDEDAALDLIARAAEDGLPRRDMHTLTVPGAVSDLDEVAAPFLRRARGAPAPAKALEGVRMAYTTPLDEGLAWERETFTALNASPESRAMRHVFFAERQAAKIADIPADTTKRPVETAGVIGAGTMGAGIAMCFADAGIPVTIVEQDRERLDAGLANIRRSYEAMRDKGRLAPETAEARLASITGSVAMRDLGAADVVVEAVFEAMDVKREVFAQLDAICKPGAILATNTSTLDVNEIAAATGRPEDVIGLHFFSPAHIMKLLEVVRAEKTAKDVVATAMDLGRRLGKIAVLVGVCNGFAGNRMFINFNREAQILIEEGALPWQIDKVLTDWGLAMGPLSVMDLAGLDVGYRIRKARGAQTPYPFTTADRLAEAGRLGQKTGAGWYRYPEGARRGEPDPEVEALIEQVSREKGITRRPVSDDEILHRCLWQLVNTGYQILEEGIAQRASDLDVIFVNGYGFPRSRGGPMFHAQEVGLDRVAADVSRYHDAHGAHWAPSAMLLREAGKAPPA